MPGSDEPAPQPEQPVPVGEAGWRIFSNVNEVYGLAYDSGKLYAATLGGAVVWDLASGAATKYTTLDGLRHISTYDVVICSIPQKRVIFATEYGLSFYDPGTGSWDNTQITPQDSNVWKARINKLYCDQGNNRLMIAAFGVGVLDLQSGAYTRYSKDQGLQWDGVGDFSAFGKDIWVASGYKYASLIRDGKVVSYDKENGLPADSAYSVMVMPKGVAWFGVNSGLVSFDGKTWKLYEKIEGLPTSAMGLALTSEGKVWLGGHSKVCLFDPAGGNCQKLVSNPLNAPVYDVVLDDKDTPYFATKQGILVLKGDALEAMVYPGEQLANNFVVAVGEDAQGMIWVATDSGAQRLDPRDVEADWEIFKYDSAKPDGPCATSFNGVYSQADGSVWFTTGAGKACGYDGQKWTTYGKDQGMVGGSISSVAVDGKGQIWVGTNEAVNIWDGSSTKVLSEADGLPAKTVRMVWVDGDTVWIGTTAGLARYQNQKLETVLSKEKAPKPEAANVKQMVKEPSGSYLLATPAGIVRLDGDQADLIFTPQPISGIFGIPVTSISALALGAGGHIWAGTYAGVYHFDGSQWEQITPENGLPATNVNALIVDRSGAVWVGAGYTNSGGGLARYVPGAAPAALPPKPQSGEQPAQPQQPAAPASGDMTLAKNGLPVMAGAQGVIETNTTLNYQVIAKLPAVRDFYLQALPKVGWLLDLDEKGKCRDNDRCMGWHGSYDDPATTTWFFLQGEHAYLTLNLIEGEGKVNVVVSVNPQFK